MRESKIEWNDKLLIMVVILVNDWEWFCNGILGGIGEVIFKILYYF